MNRRAAASVRVPANRSPGSGAASGTDEFMIGKQLRELRKIKG